MTIASPYNGFFTPFDDVGGACDDVFNCIYLSIDFYSLLVSLRLVHHPHNQATTVSEQRSRNDGAVRPTILLHTYQCNIRPSK